MRVVHGVDQNDWEGLVGVNTLNEVQRLFICVSEAYGFLFEYLKK